MLNFKSLGLSHTFAPAGIFSGGARSTKGGLVRGSQHGGSGVEPTEAGEVFKKFVKNQCKFSNFLQILHETLRCFQNFLNILSSFCKNLGKNLENFRNMHYRGFGARSPSIANLLKS